MRVEGEKNARLSEYDRTKAGQRGNALHAQKIARFLFYLRKLVI